jgi:hypothetical protein
MFKNCCNAMTAAPDEPILRLVENVVPGHTPAASAGAADAAEKATATIAAAPMVSAAKRVEVNVI